MDTDTTVWLEAAEVLAAVVGPAHHTTVPRLDKDGIVTTHDVCRLPIHLGEGPTNLTLWFTVETSDPDEAVREVARALDGLARSMVGDLDVPAVECEQGGTIQKWYQEKVAPSVADELAAQWGHTYDDTPGTAVDNLIATIAHPQDDDR